MNERIRELAEQAGGGPSKWYTNPDVLEYFAELIIRECAAIADVYSAGQIILDEFGVEE